MIPKRQRAKRQRGLATVEFAIVSAVLMVVLFAVIEFGRLLHTFSVLSESTRRAVRVAAVCPINDPAITTAATFGGIPGFSATNVAVAYLDQNGGAIGNPGASFTNIRYVRVQIVGYTYQMVIPFVNLSLAVPNFRSILPRESLGVVNGASSSC